MDYVALAKQAGGTSATPIAQPTGAVNYAALALQNGGTASSAVDNNTAIRNIVNQSKNGATNQGISDISSQAINATKNEASTAIGNLKQDIQSGVQGLKDGNLLKTGVRAGFGTIADLAKLILSPVTGIMSASTNAIANTASENKTVQNVSQSPVISGGLDLIGHAEKSLSNVQQKYPEASKAISDILNTILIAAGGEAAPGEIATTEGDINAVKSTVTGASNVIASGVDNTIAKTSETIANIPTAIKDKIMPVKTNTEQLQSVASDWTKPAEIQKSSYDNARAVLQKDPSVPQFLAENKMNPYAHIEDGKYNTESSAQTLRDTAGSVTSDSLRPALHLADYSTPKMPVESLSVSPTNEYSLTPDNAETIQAIIDKKIAALERKYPDGMNLVNQLDEKITYDKNGGYKPYKSNLDNNEAIANRSIADSLRASLETNAPKEIPIHDVQAYSSKFYKAADYLDALNGKKAPVSLGQTAVRYGAKILGAKAGGLLGGDLVSEFVGYHVGKVLEQAVENMTNPMRDSFLKNMSVTNPPAYAKLTEYLKQQGIDVANRLQLPPAPEQNTISTVIDKKAPIKTIIKGGKPIATPLPADPSGVRLINAKKVRPVQNPKTGKFTKVYSSDLPR